MLWIYAMDLRYESMSWVYDVIPGRCHTKWRSRAVQSHDPRQGPLEMASQRCPKPGSSTGATPNRLPERSKATILDRGHSKWPSRGVQSHDPRQGPRERSRAHSRGGVRLPEVSKATILDRGQGAQPGTQPGTQRARRRRTPLREHSERLFLTTIRTL